MYEIGVPNLADVAPCRQVLSVGLAKKNPIPTATCILRLRTIVSVEKVSSAPFDSRVGRSWAIQSRGIYGGKMVLGFQFRRDWCSDRA